MNEESFSLRDILRIQAMSIVLGYDESLLYFVFYHKEPRLRLPAAELLLESQALSYGEQVLAKVALDLWNGQGGASVTEIVENLDQDKFLNIILGLIHYREVPAEDLWNALEQSCSE